MRVASSNVTNGWALALGLVVIAVLIALVAWAWQMTGGAEGPAVTFFSGDGDRTVVTP